MDPPAPVGHSVLNRVHAPKDEQRLLPVSLRREALSCSLPSRGRPARTLPPSVGVGPQHSTKTARNSAAKDSLFGAGDASSPRASIQVTGWAEPCPTGLAGARASCGHLTCGQYWRHPTQAATTITRTNCTSTYKLAPRDVKGCRNRGGGRPGQRDSGEGTQQPQRN